MELPTNSESISEVKKEKENMSTKGNKQDSSKKNQLESGETNLAKEPKSEFKSLKWV